MKKRCDRNRKRSKRRQICCPIHNCYLDSASPKFPLYADTAGQLQVRGMGNKTSRLVMAAHSNAVPIPGEWIEAFWCIECQRQEWFHVRKVSEHQYQLSLAPSDLWRNVTGVVDPNQNPTVSEYSFRSSRNQRAYGLKSYRSL